jgi:RimJ/RimL family protein N-acetyltransferase
MRFDTKSLILRQYMTTDDDDLLILMNDASVQETANPGYPAPMTVAALKAYMEKQSKELIRVIAVEKKTGDFVASAGLKWSADSTKNRDATLEIAVTPAKQSKGYGTEIVNFLVDHGMRHLALHRISLVVWEGNPAAYALYKKW